MDESDGNGKELIEANQSLCFLEGIGKLDISLHAITRSVNLIMMRIKGRIGR